MIIRTIAFLTIIYFTACSNNEDALEPSRSWSVWNGNYTSNKYSSLDQVDTTNVQRLQLAWEYHTGDVDTAARSQIQCSPIIVNGIMYGTSPQLKLVALDAATGQPKWVFSPFDAIHEEKNMQFVLNNNRGVTYWTDGKDDERI